MRDGGEGGCTGGAKQAAAEGTLVGASRSGGHVAAAAGSPLPAPAAENGGAVPATPGGRRAGMLLRVCAGKEGAAAGLLLCFSDL